MAVWCCSSVRRLAGRISSPSSAPGATCTCWPVAASNRRARGSSWLWGPAPPMTLTSCCPLSRGGPPRQPRAVFLSEDPQLHRHCRAPWKVPGSRGEAVVGQPHLCPSVSSKRPRPQPWVSARDPTTPRLSVGQEPAVFLSPHPPCTASPSWGPGVSPVETCGRSALLPRRPPKSTEPPNPHHTGVSPPCHQRALPVFQDSSNSQHPAR